MPLFNFGAKTHAIHSFHCNFKTLNPSEGKQFNVSNKTMQKSTQMKRQNCALTALKTLLWLIIIWLCNEKSILLLQLQK
jgi:hypothetical protein